jgi:glycoprotein 6-alpha-L-fucosyltransferase
MAYRWVGVIMSYLLRPSQNSIQRLADFKQHHDWASPVVGVHIRRTDKLNAEAFLHKVEEYLQVGPKQGPGPPGQSTLQQC